MYAGREWAKGPDGRSGSKLGISALSTLLCLGAPGIAVACDFDQITVRDGDAAARFRIEVADDPAERGQGLMFRESLPSSAGMLFIFEDPQPVGFWMENTLIPLDMLFISANGTVTRLHENAIPGDRTTIFGGNEVKYVLEINGGLSALLGIGEGAEVQHPTISQESAVFPCE